MASLSPSQPLDLASIASTTHLFRHVVEAQQVPCAVLSFPPVEISSMLSPERRSASPPAAAQSLLASSSSPCFHYYHHWLGFHLCRLQSLLLAKWRWVAEKRYERRLGSGLGLRLEGKTERWRSVGLSEGKGCWVRKKGKRGNEKR